MKPGIKMELYHDNFQNFKRYDIPKAQLVIADIPYNIGIDAYASNPMWYEGGNNKNGESKHAKSAFFSTDCGIYAFLQSSFDKRAERTRESACNDCVLCI